LNSIVKIWGYRLKSLLKFIKIRQIIIIILFALGLLIGTALGYIFTSNTAILEIEIEELENEINLLQIQLDSLNETYNTYVTHHHFTDSEYNLLQSQLNSLNNELTTLKEPKLIFVNLRGQDVRPSEGSPYLHTWGNICNVGTETAKNSTIYVVLYRNGSVIKDLFIDLGSILGESWVKWDENIYYEGEALTKWSITQEWKN
jgi:hypothetical protein